MVSNCLVNACHWENQFYPATGSNLLHPLAYKTRHTKRYMWFQQRGTAFTSTLAISDLHCYFFYFTGAHWLVSKHFYLPWKSQETAAIQWQQATSHNYSPTIQVHKSPYRCPGSETVCLKWMDNLSFVICCQDFQLLDTVQDLQDGPDVS